MHRVRAILFDIFYALFLIPAFIGGFMWAALVGEEAVRLKEAHLLRKQKEEEKNES